MDMVERAFRAEVDSLNAMRASMENAIAQVKGFETIEGGVMQVRCPAAGRMIASIAAGHVPQELATQSFIISIAEDSGHDVAFGLGNMRENTAVQRRDVNQPMVLGEEVSWNQVIETMEIGSAYMDMRIKRLTG